jgi:hypothetical protein
MDEIRRQDQRLFVRELLVPWRIVLSILGLFLVYGIIDHSFRFGLFAFAGLLALVVLPAIKDSKEKRFHNKRLKALWTGCQDRLLRFEEVLKKMRKDQIADLQEMPRTIRELSNSIYVALRKADIVAKEVMESERDMLAQPPVWNSPGGDAQSQELYRLADKNIAEYRQQFAGVMAGVQRTEAQSAVYMTTLDTLRMKMIGYRLVGKNPELSSHDFLEALAEARAQLQSIDTALDELDLGHYPKMIAAVPPATPPPIPEEARQHIRP